MSRPVVLQGRVVFHKGSSRRPKGRIVFKKVRPIVITGRVWSFVRGRPVVLQGLIVS